MTDNLLFFDFISNSRYLKAKGQAINILKSLRNIIKIRLIYTKQPLCIKQKRPPNGSLSQH
ncbi:hypothetical protein, partial [Bacteroides stercoris]